MVSLAQLRLSIEIKSSDITIKSKEINCKLLSFFIINNDIRYVRPHWCCDQNMKTR